MPPLVSWTVGKNLPPSGFADLIEPKYIHFKEGNLVLLQVINCTKNPGFLRGRMVKIADETHCCNYGSSGGGGGSGGKLAV